MDKGFDVPWKHGSTTKNVLYDDLNFQHNNTMNKTTSLLFKLNAHNPKELN